MTTPSVGGSRHASPERLDVDDRRRRRPCSATPGATAGCPVGPATLLADELVGHDPPPPVQLTNAIGLVMDHVDDVIREQPAVVDAHDVHVRGDDAWHLTTVEHGAIAGRQHGSARPRRRRGGLPHAGHRDSQPSGWHNPGLDPQRVDTVLGTSCVIVGLMRRLQLSGVTFEAPPPVMARHPSIGSPLPAPLRLYGRRVTLRPLTPQDFPEWSEVRRRNDAWLTPWEPRRPPAQLDPTVNREAFNARCAARDRDATAGVAYGFGRLRRPPAGRRGQPQQRAARRDAERHRRVLDRPGPAPGRG